MISRSEAGFTLIEILMVVTLLGVVSVVSVDVISDTLNEQRFQSTLQKMQQIANAMAGDSTLQENGVRTSFGYAGDVGTVPTASQGGISALLTLPGSVSAWAINTTVKFGIGWNGPYLNGGNSGTDYTTDGWGNALMYTPTSTPPTIVSYGADGVSGGTGFNQDITVSLPTTIAASVSGYITTHYSAYTGAAQVQMNYPDGSGNLTQSLYTVTAPSGYFTFSSVPLGTRSITVYIGTQASPTQTIGPVLVTVDKLNYLTPPNIFDTSP